jgi:plasmid stabilization system protein ParE
MNLVVRPRFYLDIEEEVYWLLANANANVAQRWHEAVWETAEGLPAHPLIGRKRNDLKPRDVRSWRVNHFGR